MHYELRTRYGHDYIHFKMTRQNRQSQFCFSPKSVCSLYDIWTCDASHSSQTHTTTGSGVVDHYINSLNNQRRDVLFKSFQILVPIYRLVIRS
jgi:hypothetical protein